MPCVSRYSIPYQSAPILADKVVDSIRKKLATITWLQYSLPDIKRVADDAGLIWPVIRDNKTNSGEIQIAPDSDLKSLSFIEILESNYGDNGTMSDYTVSVHVWFNKTKIDAVTYDITTQLMSEVIRVLQKQPSGINAGTIISETDPAAVWDFSGIRQSKHTAEMIGRYGGFVLSFSYYQNDCYPVKTISTGQGCP